MNPRIGLITIITNDIDRLKQFYNKVIGFPIIEDLENYIEFENKGTRFALTTRHVMYEGTNHESYHEKRKGQSFELAFPVDTPEEVEEAYQDVVSRGATPVKAPEMMPWGRMTAFFADPDGNIHELYSLRPEERE